jgi:hypothetical protein
MAKPTPAQMKAAVEAFKKKFTGGFYHGSPSPSIKKFDSEKSSKFDKVPQATFLTKNPDFAESFLPRKNTPDVYDDEISEQYKKGATVYPVNANLGQHFNANTNEGKKEITDYLTQKYSVIYPPLNEDELISKINKEIVAATSPLNSWKWLESPQFMQHLKEKNYDSFHVTEGGVENVGIFDPKNIRGKFAKYNPEDAESPDFMKAEGGSIKGGKLGALAKLAKNVHSQNPKVAQALEEYLKGNISQEERIRILNQYLPIRQRAELPPAYTDEQIINALMANKQSKALAPVPAGAKVGNRLDIPAYTQHGVYVDTTHDAAGKPISYGRTGHLKDVEFSSKPNQAVRVGLGTKEQALTPMGAEIGSAKSPFALIKGTNVGTADDEVRRMMEEMMRDPAYTQIGMDPRRGSQFFNKETGMPVFAAEEKFQAGPLVIVPKRGLEETSLDDPRLNLTDFPGKRYAAGGKIAKKALEFAKSVPFVHYSKAPNISTLEPNMYGTGIKGQESARLKDAPDIRPRSYFYTQAGGRQPEQGLGSHKYQGVAEDIYPLHEDPAGFSQIAKVKAIDPYMMSQGFERIDEQVHLNELERLIKQAGYKGYANDDVGLLFDRTPVMKAD